MVTDDNYTKPNQMNREEIKQYLPHREPMLLVDSTERIGDEVHSVYHVRGDEFFLQGHFPGFPVVPGVIICEIMAQSCAMLLGEGLKGHTPFYAGLDKVKFKKMVRPGDDIEVTARIKDSRSRLIVTQAEAKVGGEMCCKAEMTFYLLDNKDIK